MSTPPQPGTPASAAVWNSWLGTYVDVVLLVVAALPLALLAVRVLVDRRRRTGIGRGRAWRLSVADVGMVYGTLPFVWLTLLPGGRSGTGGGAVSLVPFRDLAAMPPFQVVGNLLVLAALGFFLPVRFPALASTGRVLMVGAVASVAIETAQLVFRLDRVSSIDDVLLNAAGAGVAALASRRWWSGEGSRGGPCGGAPSRGATTGRASPSAD